jgi:hypothetical protein
MADPEIMEPGEQEILSAREEGILAYFKHADKRGWTFYGMRSYSLALIFALGFVAVCLVGFLQGDSPEIRQMCFNGLQTAAILSLGWFAITKAKSGTP